ALDGLEVGQHTAQPSFVYVEHSAALCLCLNGILRLFLCSYEQNGASVSYDIRNCFICIVNHSHRFLKVDDINTISFCVNVLRSDLDGLEVGQHTAQPSFVYVEHSAALCLCLNGILRLFLCSYEQYGASVSYDIRNCFICIVNHSHRFLKVDDINTISFCVNVL